MISAILLAAGKSKRMNGENKLIKNFKGTPLIKYAVENILNSSIDELLVILGYQNEIVEKTIDKNNKIKIILNKSFESGMASSIKTGLNHLSQQTEYFFICLADMPMINSNIYNQIIKYKNENEIIVPTYKNLQGNPILFSISMKEKIKNIEGDIGAKKIIDMNKDKILFYETNDLSVIKDFNDSNSFNI
mgnify:CR=1 FL=1